MFQVFQNGKPADCFGYPEMHKSWNKSKFETKHEAEVYAIHWAYPFSEEECRNNAFSMEIGKDYDFSMLGTSSDEDCLVLMRIEEVG